eukprot:227658-Rhodomonas_salina.2
MLCDVRYGHSVWCYLPTRSLFPTLSLCDVRYWHSVRCGPSLYARATRCPGLTKETARAGVGGIEAG